MPISWLCGAADQAVKRLLRPRITGYAGLRFQRASMPRRLDSGKPLSSCSCHCRRTQGWRAQRGLLAACSLASVTVVTVPPALLHCLVKEKRSTRQTTSTLRKHDGFRSQDVFPRAVDRGTAPSPLGLFHLKSSNPPCTATTLRRPATTCARLSHEWTALNLLAQAATAGRTLARNRSRRARLVVCV